MVGIQNGLSLTPLKHFIQPTPLPINSVPLSASPLLPTNSRPGSRQRSANSLRPGSGRGGPGEFERTARRPGSSPFLLATLCPLEGPHAVMILLPVAAAAATTAATCRRCSLASARECATDDVRAGG
jgi:hypothetical protein